jgi:hypothetical protein
MVSQLNEQAAQIQKVSAQLEVSKPAPQVVMNKPKAANKNDLECQSTVANCIEKAFALAASAFVATNDATNYTCC